MKIAFVSNLVEPTGGDNILYHHALGLTKLGHQVDSYFSAFMNSSQEHNEDWNSGQVNINLYGDKLSQYDFTDYDVVVANGLHGAAQVKRIDAKSKAWFCQNFDPYIFGKTQEIDEIYEDFDTYLTYSHDLGKIIQHYYGHKDIVYCNNGIDYKAFKP